MTDCRNLLNIEDNIDLKAVTLANLNGEQRTYSFEKWPTTGEAGADFIHPVSKAGLRIVNVYSTFKPFYIYEEGTLIIPYGIADQRSRVATVSVPELLSRLRRS